jgi:hypothetical protein
MLSKELKEEAILFLKVKLKLLCMLTWLRETERINNYYYFKIK